MTMIVTVAVALPPELDAVTVYVVTLAVAVGVPEIAPVEVEKARPAGSVDEIAQDVTVPPLEVGVMVVMVESLLNVRKLGLYVTEDGATSLTTMVTVAVPLPPAFVAVIVYCAEDVIAVGVPDMAPVELEMLSPAGNVGEIVHAATGPPFAVGVTVVIATSFTRVIELGL